MAHTIQDVHQMPDAMPVLHLTATITDIAERKSGESKFGPWSIQFLTLEDTTGKISVMAKDRPEDFSAFDWIGKQVVIAAHKSDKHGWQGALAFDNDYKDKHNPERVIKLTKTGQIELAEGELAEPAVEAPSRNGGPHRDEAEEPAIADALRARSPHATSERAATASTPEPSTAPTSDPASAPEPASDADVAPPSQLSLPEFLVLAAHVHERCAELTSPAESATLTSTVLEQVALGRVQLTEDEHLAILLRLHNSSVAQFCEFISLKKGAHYEDLEMMSSKIKREAIQRLQDDPLDLIEQMDRTAGYAPATNGGAARG